MSASDGETPSHEKRILVKSMRNDEAIRRDTFSFIVSRMGGAYQIQRWLLQSNDTMTGFVSQRHASAHPPSAEQTRAMAIAADQ